MGDLITGVFPEQIEPWKQNTIVAPVAIDAWKHGENIALLEFDDSDSEVLQDSIVYIVDTIIDDGIHMYQKIPKIGMKNTIHEKNISKESLRWFTTEVWQSAFAEWNGMQDTFEYIYHDDGIHFPKNFITETITHLLSKYRGITCKTLLDIGIPVQDKKSQLSIPDLNDLDILFCIIRIINNGINNFIEARSDEYTIEWLQKYTRIYRIDMITKAQGILALFWYIEKHTTPHQPTELIYKKKAIEYSLGHYRELIFEHLSTIFPQK